MRYTGCTSYDIRQAKIFAKLGIVEEKAVFHRERLNKRKLKHFVSFVALLVFNLDLFNSHFSVPI